MSAQVRTTRDARLTHFECPHARQATTGRTVHAGPREVLDVTRGQRSAVAAANHRDLHVRHACQSLGAGFSQPITGWPRAMTCGWPSSSTTRCRAGRRVVRWTVRGVPQSTHPVQWFSVSAGQRVDMPCLGSGVAGSDPIRPRQEYREPGDQDGASSNNTSSCARSRWWETPCSR